MGRDEMSISAFSRRSLLSVKALRLYDELGILLPNRVEPSSGYRYYGEEQLEVARRISLLRQLEVPLAEIAALIVLPSEESSNRLLAWWQHEEEGMARRRDLLQYIRGSILGDGSHQDSGYEVEVRRVPETTYLYLSQHVHGPNLPAVISSAEDVLRDRAEAYGGACGLLSVVFHGVSNLDSDGPVDVCLPVASGEVGDNVRVEASHLQAFIRLNRPQVAFPQILQVYQALRRWIPRHNYAISGPPREMYLGDFHTPASHEPVCDVAFPIVPSKGTNDV